MTEAEANALLNEHSRLVYQSARGKTDAEREQAAYDAGVLSCEITARMIGDSKMADWHRRNRLDGKLPSGVNLKPNGVVTRPQPTDAELDSAAAVAAVEDLVDAEMAGDWQPQPEIVH